MNNVVLSGNVANIYVNEKTTRVVIADNYKDKTIFIPVTCFGLTALFAAKHLTKGDHVSVVGKIGMYKTSEGREVLDIVASSINFEGYKRPSKQTAQPAQPSFIPADDRPTEMLRPAAETGVQTSIDPFDLPPYDDTDVQL